MSAPSPTPTPAAGVDNAAPVAVPALTSVEPARPAEDTGGTLSLAQGPEELRVPLTDVAIPRDPPHDSQPMAINHPSADPAVVMASETVAGPEGMEHGHGVPQGDPAAPLRFNFVVPNWGNQDELATPTRARSRPYPVSMLAGARRPHKRRRSSRSPSVGRAGPSTDRRMPPPEEPRVPSGEAADLFRDLPAASTGNLFAQAPQPRADREVTGAAPWQPDFLENFAGVETFANLDGALQYGLVDVPPTPVLTPADAADDFMGPMNPVALHLPPPILHDEGEAPPLPDHVDITFDDSETEHRAPADGEGRRARPPTPYPAPGQHFRAPRGPTRQDIAPTMAGPIPPPNQLAQPHRLWPGHQALGATAPPHNGFPEVHFGDPYGVYRGLTDDRSYYMRSQNPDTSVVVTIWNYSANYNPRPGGQAPPPPPIHVIIPILADAISSMIGGEDSFVIVPPEAPLNTVTTPHSAPFAWGVLDLSMDAARTLRATRVISLPEITFFVHSNVPTITRYLFSARGFAHNRNNDIALTVQRVFLGRDVLSRFWALMQNNPEYGGLTSGQALRRIVGTLRVRVLTLENGTILAGIYVNPPTNSPDRWLALIAHMAQILFTSNRNTTGFVARSMRCLGCHGTDHPTHLCQYPELQGWHGRPAGTQVIPPLSGGGGALPPPPPAPGMPGLSNRRARHGQYEEADESDYYYTHPPARGGSKRGGRGSRGGIGGNGYNGGGYNGFRRGG
ncbi:hypothetical protein K466DRAFT_600450 [Polyporus arcularius HHB13444]|uniref:Uncharacterized protein n=1 Tax=Polyporus arcularius HHB13444 TaxID=1314778 RepID=A0A5C3PAK7_9APHY|nr:hypothetical protein K466DRAFT_600450 [Polyporus arcularius HHB13444]